MAIPAGQRISYSTARMGMRIWSVRKRYSKWEPGVLTGIGRDRLTITFDIDGSKYLRQYDEVAMRITRNKDKDAPSRHRRPLVFAEDEEEAGPMDKELQDMNKRKQNAWPLRNR